MGMEIGKEPDRGRARVTSSQESLIPYLFGVANILSLYPSFSGSLIPMIRGNEAIDPKSPS